MITQQWVVDVRIRVPWGFDERETGKGKAFYDAMYFGSGIDMVETLSSEADFPMIVMTGILENEGDALTLEDFWETTATLEFGCDIELED